MIKKTILAAACIALVALPVAAFAATATTEKQPADAAAEEKVVEPSEEVLAWAEGMDCASCHVKEGDSAAAEGSTMSKHAAFNLECVSCHFDDILIKRHEKAKPDSKMPLMVKRSAVHTETCANCHPAEKLASATEGSEVLVDSKGTVVNPHDLPQGDGHKDLSCSSCHKMHDTDKTPAEKAQKVCSGCHHADVFECGTCH